MAIKKTNKIVKKISIVIPTYNEEANIERLVRRIDRALSAQNIIYEIIFVDDNSTDSTREKIVALHHTYPVKGYLKEGKKGKAFSLYEGFQKAKYDVLCMIDADLQYPPEAIPHMMKKLDTADIVVANRKKYKVHFLRKFLSFGFRTVFGKLIFGFTSDIQSGLKVFKKEVWRDIQYVPSAGWAFDLEFLYKAHELGFTLTDYDITFTERNAGASKVNFLKTIWEIGSNTLKTRFKIISPHHVSTDNGKSMEGAGIRYKKKKYITHTTLPHTVSAIRTFHRGQKITGFILLFLLIAGLLYNWLNTLLVITAILSFIYFVDVIFNLYLVWKSLNYSQEITFTQEELDKIDENKLPIYSILCPLYKEAHVIPQFIDAISKIEWPKGKLCLCTV